MIPRPVAIPPGVCLTSVWSHLSPLQRRDMLRVVQGEAEQVARETAAYRAGRDVRTLSPREAGEAWDRERLAAAARLDELVREAASFRVGKRLRSPKPPLVGGLPAPAAGAAS